MANLPIVYHRRNRRKYDEYFCVGHVKLNDFKEGARKKQLVNQYLYKKTIPEYPRPEFHVSHLKHDTNQDGLRGIKEDKGFKDPSRSKESPEDPFEGSLVWWGLDVGPEEITSAEKRLLETTYPDRTEEQVQKQQSFLEKFATSPAFMKSSMLGSYRFTFPVEEVLKAYSEQFCGGAQPVMRQFRTVLYRQEMVYVVLVHSPANQEQFSRFPLLTDEPNAVCAYRDGCFIWRSEAMCETHGYELVKRPVEMQMDICGAGWNPEFYVWDNVAIALHVEDQVLKFDADQLRQNLRFCSKARCPVPKATFDDFPQAEHLVKELWPDSPAPLERHENPDE